MATKKVAKTASVVMQAIRGAESKANMRVGASGQDRHSAWDAAHKLAKEHGAHPSDLAHIRENLRAEKQALSNKRVGKGVSTKDNGHRTLDQMAFEATRAKIRRVGAPTAKLESEVPGHGTSVGSTKKIAKLAAGVRTDASMLQQNKRAKPGHAMLPVRAEVDTQDRFKREHAKLSKAVVKKTGGVATAGMQAAPAVPVALRIGKKGGRFTLSASGKKRYVK
jgi:hypothetical protein